MKNIREGILITFEGGEGAGKTTLIETVAKELTAQGYRVLKTREPGGTALGEQVRSVLLHQTRSISPYAELCLFLASRAEHIAEVIQPALQEGKVVLCDRFNDSSVAYQGAARGLGTEQVKQFCDFISQGLKPNLTIYLDLPPEIGLARLAAARQEDRIESEVLDFHQKIHRAYLAIHKADPKRFCLVDAKLAPQAVSEAALRYIHPLLARYV